MWKPSSLLLDQGNLAVSGLPDKNNPRYPEVSVPSWISMGPVYPNARYNCDNIFPRYLTPLSPDVDDACDTLYTPKIKGQNHFHTQGVSIRCHNASFSRTKTHILKNQNNVHHLQPNSKTYTKSQTYPSTQTRETAANAIFVFPYKTSALGIYIPTRRQ
ncbi:hypothetical protein Bbelb_262960 [Branchiostoma belcheri]|nr:hypothetical protein Bbelb_262960 [Branchiostoma belcheri]